MNQHDGNAMNESPDDEERVLMDPDTWDWDAVEELEPVRNAGVVVATRLSRDELERVERAARAEGVTLSDS
jgi:hypothetical protein